MTTDLCEKYGFVDRLGNVSTATGGERPLPVSRHGVGGNRNHWYFGQLPGSALSLVVASRAIHLRELNVHHDQIGWVLREGVERLGCIGCFNNLVALGPQQKSGQPPIYRVVFNQQNFLFIS